MINRRHFIAQSAVLLSGCALYQGKSQGKSSLLSTESPKAVAMWDYSWLLRRYDGGGFEDWDKSLDELVYRGYDTVRIDCFPHFISTPSSDQKEKVFSLPVNKKRKILWGNEITVTITPQESLTIFLRKCQERRTVVQQVPIYF